MEFELSYLKILKDNAVKSATFNMPENLENSAVVTGMEKVSFHSNPQNDHCQGMFKLPYNCMHFTHKQGNTQNPSS